MSDSGKLSRKTYSVTGNPALNRYSDLEEIDCDPTDKRMTIPQFLKEISYFLYTFCDEK